MRNFECGIKMMNLATCKSRADDEAVSCAPERFAFRQGANVAQAFGQDAQAWAKYQCPSPVRIFKEAWTILLFQGEAWDAESRFNSV